VSFREALEKRNVAISVGEDKNTSLVILSVAKNLIGVDKTIRIVMLSAAKHLCATKPIDIIFNAHCPQIPHMRSE